MRTMRITCCTLLAAVGAWAATDESDASPLADSATAFLEAHDARVRAVVMRDSTDSLTADEREQVRVLINEAFDLMHEGTASRGVITYG